MKKASVLAAILSVFVSTCCWGQAVAWEYPVIKGYGPAAPLPHAAVQPDKSLRYKVLFDVRGAAKSIKEVNPGLNNTARFINVMATAGVMPRDMDLVVIIHSEATPIALNNKMFRKKYKMDNPNLKLIDDLKKAGVKVYVCGQALAEFKFQHAWVNKDLTIALSALVVIPTYELKGYAYVPFL